VKKMPWSSSPAEAAEATSAGRAAARFLFPWSEAAPLTRLGSSSRTLSGEAAGIARAWRRVVTMVVVSAGNYN
jgi:hypothetical protein